MIRTFFTVIFIALAVLISIPITIVFWSINKAHPKSTDVICLRYAQTILKILLLIAGTQVTVLGEENIPKGEAVLYVPNHRSFYDILITYSRVPSLTGYVAKESIGNIPLISTWFSLLYCLPLSRSDTRKALKTILTGIEFLKQGISICIFPEGTRSHGKDLLPFHEGSMKLAEKSGCAIIPVAISNSDEIFEKHMPTIKSCHVTVEYGTPIRISELPKENKKFIGAYTKTKIEEMLAGHKALPEGALK
ncbi:1-acyl-sn-glycerol-3-phosphate acyltransferase [Clostridia bacterium]|nr:1-acyl-sn-glycerol-3-phosphate acyltransferase [Clostridia bacterium]